MWWNVVECVGGGKRGWFGMQHPFGQTTPLSYADEWAQSFRDAFGSNIPEVELVGHPRVESMHLLRLLQFLHDDSLA
jgi:hypothetical protein